MFKKHSLQVKMVKDDEEPTDELYEIDAFEVKAEVVVREVKEILKMIGIGVLAYVAADAARQIAIERAKQ